MAQYTDIQKPNHKSHYHCHPMFPRRRNNNLMPRWMNCSSTPRIGKIIGSECASASTTRVHHPTRWYRPGRTTMTNHLQTELGRSWMTWCNRFAIQKHTRPDTVQLHLAFASYRIGKKALSVIQTKKAVLRHRFQPCTDHQVVSRCQDNLGPHRWPACAPR